MKHRLERVNEVVKRELSELILRDLNFEPAVLVTITAVDISPDLKQCHVYVIVIGGSYQKSDVSAELEELPTSLQRDRSKRVVLKRTPHLHLKLVNAIERRRRVV